MSRRYYKIIFHVLFFASFFYSLTATAKEFIDDTEIAQLIFEDSLFNYYKENYPKAALQFDQLIEKYPDYKNRTTAINYYISSLFHMHQDEKIAEVFKTYSSDINVGSHLTLIENMQMREKYTPTFPLLDYLSEKTFSHEEKDYFNYLRALSLSSINKTNEAFTSIGSISKNSKYYPFGIVLKSQLLFKKRQSNEALNNLKIVLKNAESKDSNTINALIRDKIVLLAGQINFEMADYSRAIEYFNKISEGKLYFDALTGLHWAYFKNSDFLKAAKILHIIKNNFAKKFFQEDLLLNLSFSYFYARDYKNSIKYFKELDISYEIKKNLMNRILTDDSLCLDFSYFILTKFFGVYSKSVISLQQFEGFPYTLIQMSPEILKAAEEYVFIEQYLNEITRASNLLDNYHVHIKKRYVFFSEFIRNYEQLKTDYSRFRETIVKIEIPDADITKENAHYLDERLETLLIFYKDKYKRPLIKLEEQLIKVLVYEEYTSQFSFTNNVNIFRLTLRMINLLENLFGEKGSKWLKNIDKVYEHSKESLSMMEKVISSNDLSLIENANKIQKNLIESIIKSLRKEALRITTEMELNRPKIEMAMKESQKKVVKLQPN